MLTLSCGVKSAETLTHKLRVRWVWKLDLAATYWQKMRTAQHIVKVCIYSGHVAVSSDMFICTRLVCFIPMNRCERSWSALLPSRWKYQWPKCPVENLPNKVWCVTNKNCSQLKTLWNLWIVYCSRTVYPAITTRRRCFFWGWLIDWLINWLIFEVWGWNIKGKTSDGRWTELCEITLHFLWLMKNENYKFFTNKLFSVDF